MTTFYLIGGAPRCGKTTIAKQLSKNKCIPWVSADTFESIVSAYIPESKYEEYFPKGVMRKKTNRSNDEMYTTYTSKEITDAYIKQSSTVWDAIEMFVQVESKNNHAYIIEGHQIHPALIKRLEELTSAKIQSIFVGRSDAQQLVQDATTYKNTDDWFVDKTEQKETFSLIADMLVLYSEYFEQEANEYGYQYISMDDFKSGVERAMDLL